MQRFLRPALEQAQAGSAVRELEHVLYAQLEDYRPLQQAARREYQEQWELKIDKGPDNAGSGKVRVRHSQEPGGQARYDITTKVRMAKAQDRNSNVEVTVPTTVENFKQFQVLANSGMKKVRYFFPIEGTDLVWEIDMFVRDVLLTAEECLDGGTTIFRDWCKIDLEVKDKQAPLPKLPFEFAKLISAPEGQRGPKEEAQVRLLYDTAFVVKNRHT